MATLFSKIIDGEIPGRFVHTDDLAVAFLTIAPIRPGHTLVVPRAEVDQWTDAEPGLLAHCTAVAQRIGQAQKKIWGAPRTSLIIAGFEVPHLHLHVFPTWDLADLDFAKADPNPSAESLDEAARQLREALDAA